MILFGRISKLLFRFPSLHCVRFRPWTSVFAACTQQNGDGDKQVGLRVEVVH